LQLPDFPSLKNRNDEFNYLKSAREIFKICFALGVKEPDRAGDRLSGHQPPVTDSTTPVGG
jgi:hypothetical protein